jgi:hypothetical protein
MNVVWNCQCDCGELTTAITTYLKSGKKTSCGCQQYRSGSSVYNWTGCGEIPGTYIYTVKNGAVNRSIAFKLSSKFMWELFLRQNRRCALSGISLDFGTKKTASLDRIDSRRGYTEDNVQWVHKDINRMKVNYPEDYFIRLCKLVAKHSKKLLSLRGSGEIGQS